MDLENETPTFTFLEFNPRRAQRGKEAARVEIKYSWGDTEWLWMSPTDIMENLETFGDCPALQAALAAYGPMKDREYVSDIPA